MGISKNQDYKPRLYKDRMLMKHTNISGSFFSIGILFYFVLSLFSKLELGFRASLLFGGKIDTKLNSNLIKVLISFRLALESL